MRVNDSLEKEKNMVKNCRNCANAVYEGGFKREKSYWLWCRRLFYRVRGAKDRHVCRHWRELK